MERKRMNRRGRTRRKGKRRKRKRRRKRRRGRGDSRYTCPRHISSMHRIAGGWRDITIIFDILFVIVPGSGSILRSRRNRRVEVTVPITIIVVDRSGSRGGNTPITAVIIVV
jgi:hypothetical protein